MILTTTRIDPLTQTLLPVFHRRTADCTVLTRVGGTHTGTNPHYLADAPLLHALGIPGLRTRTWFSRGRGGESEWTPEGASAPHKRCFFAALAAKRASKKSRRARWNSVSSSKPSICRFCCCSSW